MNFYAQRFADTMDEKEVKYTEIDDHTLKISFNGDSIKTVTIYAIFEEDGENLVQLRSWEIESFASNEAAGLAVCNEMNCHYRWVKFYLDKDKDVVATIDATLDDDSCGEECFSLMCRFVDIVDGAYPQIEKARWA